jgi:phosphatidylglycerophosphate synthase
LRAIADLLTALRGLLCLAVLAQAWAGPEAFETVVYLLILAWTTDILDGPIARRSKTPASAVARYDFAIDMVLIASSLAYFVLAEFVAWQLALPYAALWGGLAWWLRSKAVTMLLAFPITLLPVVIGLRHAPHAALIYVVWAAGALILAWRRFVAVVLDFLDNFKRTLG